MMSGSLFEQTGIEAEEQKRSLSFAMIAYEKARAQALYQIAEAEKRIGTEDDQRQYFMIINETRLRLPFNDPPKSYETTTTMLKFFDEEKSLQLWKNQAYDIFAACLRDMIQYLAKTWNDMGLPDTWYQKMQNPFTPVADPNLSQPILNVVMSEMKDLATHLEKTHTYRVLRYNNYEDNIYGIFFGWSRQVEIYVYNDLNREAEMFSNAAKWNRVRLNEDTAKKQEKEGARLGDLAVQLKATWGRGIQNLENCFVLSYLLSGKKDGGRIPRTMAARLNMESRRITHTVEEMTKRLDDEIRNRQKLSAAATDVKMQEAAPLPNPSFGLSIFGRPVIPITFSARPTPMDISKSGGFAIIRPFHRLKPKLKYKRR